MQFGFWLGGFGGFRLSGGLRLGWLVPVWMTWAGIVEVYVVLGHWFADLCGLSRCSFGSWG